MKPIKFYTTEVQVMLFLVLSRFATAFVACFPCFLACRKHFFVGVLFRFIVLIHLVRKFATSLLLSSAIWEWAPQQNRAFTFTYFCANTFSATSRQKERNISKFLVVWNSRRLFWQTRETKHPFFSERYPCRMRSYHSNVTPGAMQTMHDAHKTAQGFVHCPAHCTA